MTPAVEQQQILQQQEKNSSAIDSNDKEIYEVPEKEFTITVLEKFTEIQEE